MVGRLGHALARKRGGEGGRQGKERRKLVVAWAGEHFPRLYGAGFARLAVRPLAGIGGANPGFIRERSAAQRDLGGVACSSPLGLRQLPATASTGGRMRAPLGGRTGASQPYWLRLTHRSETFPAGEPVPASLQDARQSQSVGARGPAIGPWRCHPPCCKQPFRPYSKAGRCRDFAGASACRSMTPSSDQDSSRGTGGETLRNCAAWGDPVPVRMLYPSEAGAPVSAGGKTCRPFGLHATRL